MISRIVRSVASSLIPLFLATSAGTVSAQAVRGLDAIRVATGFNQPVFMTAPRRDRTRLFVVEQTGKIRIIDLTSGTIKATPFLDLSGQISNTGEEGLLGLAFDRNYAANGRFFVNYVAPGGAFNQGVTRVSVFTVSSNPDLADATSEAVLLSFDQPQNNHNAGWIGFSPRAGDRDNLYIATGDGGAGNDVGPGHSNRAATRRISPPSWAKCCAFILRRPTAPTRSRPIIPFSASLTRARKSGLMDCAILFVTASIVR